MTCAGGRSSFLVCVRSNRAFQLRPRLLELVSSLLTTLVNKNLPKNAIPVFHASGSSRKLRSKREPKSLHSVSTSWFRMPPEPRSNVVVTALRLGGQPEIAFNIGPGEGGRQNKKKVHTRTSVSSRSSLAEGALSFAFFFFRRPRFPQRGDE